MEMQDIIRQAEANIRQAIRDYGEHTSQKDVLEDISDEFIERLARDSSYAKQELRELFSKSPVWHPELDALVINGTRTHDPDYLRIYDLAQTILHEPLRTDDTGRLGLIVEAIEFFANPHNPENQNRGIEAINMLAPKAYRPGKKLSRVFKALCAELGVVDETAGSKFQRLYAQFADELTSQKIRFKLFVSINPAHFLTMSNPKNDRRGMCLTSCHSLNSTEYDYNAGCTGYALDKVSFIVFTAADPEDAETLNNRKTTRQVFAYKPGNGILLQSRMYNTAGGTHGQVEDSKLYRDLIQREISELEGQPNLWKTFDSTEWPGQCCVYRGSGFGGYPDWEYAGFGGKVCIRFSHLEDGKPIDDCVPLEVGTWGLCVKCGDDVNEGMYCDDCKEPSYDYHCDDCNDGVEFGDDLYTVYDSAGYEHQVCYDCRVNSYTLCDYCNKYHADSVMEHINGLDVCPNCLEEYYECCPNCGEYCHRDNMRRVINECGEEDYVCPNCLDSYYKTCDHCNESVHESCICDAHDADGDDVRVCEACYERLYARYEAANDEEAADDMEEVA